MNRKIIILIWALFGAWTSVAQICDDFSDGNFTENPVWQGDSVDFIVNDDMQLQLNAAISGNASISVPVQIPVISQWDVFIKLNFAPSTSNQLRLYLASDNADLANSNGYFLEIGASGSDDPITFYRQDAGVKVEIAESALGIVGSELVEIRLRINKTDIDTWNFNADLSGGMNFTNLFGAIESTHSLLGNQWSGFYCKFTETRKDKFFFDDFCVGPMMIDISPPELSNVEVLSETRVLLVFSEHLDPNAEIEDNYTLSPGLLKPISASLNQNEVTLTFQNAFENSTTYVIESQNITDLFGNVANPLTGAFEIIEVFKAEKFDLLITEIMSDPSPPISIPEAEYIEIFNNGMNPVDLQNISLTVGNNTEALPAKIIDPNEYVILVDEAFSAQFESFGNAFGIDLPNLTNSGSTIILRNIDEEIIHQIAYSDNWYQDANKDDGGWSLEMINPSNICFQKENWRASNDLRGGTPGQQNSVWETVPDVEGPLFISTRPIGNQIIEVVFNEEITDDFLQVSDFEIDPVIQILSVIKSGPTNILISLNTPLEAGRTYTLNIKAISDCQNNSTPNETFITFGLPAAPQKGDLIINEILFNPVTGGSRFVELLNVSNKIISTDGLVIGEIFNGDDNLKSIATSRILLPNKLYVFTPSIDDILKRYSVPFPTQLISTDLPTWGSDEGNVTILYNGVVLDSFNYFSNYHTPLLDDENGVSLERISTMGNTNDANIWHSAAQSAGFATPTGPNSQTRTDFAEPTEFQLINKTFSPDQDGFKDFLEILFSLVEPEIVLSITIYDASGRRVRDLIKNETVGSSTSIKWDGTDNDNQLSRVGVYIVYVDLFSANGITKQYKETCVLAQQLN